ncbi:MAG: GDP-mannose 4,6-dehydratase [Bacteroidetes Order II. Incertae sedis bacterium]|nr:GDP-mannose 4,6-dehydratase [Bacteroidetes Order II. bacterium]
MKYLVTGFSGFVARHFTQFLEENIENVQVLGIDIGTPRYHETRPWVQFEQINLLEKDRLEAIIRSFAPDYILHLASMSSVSKSWEEPEKSFTNNTNIFLNLVEALRHNHIPARLLSVGSSEEYGIVTETELPLRENMHPNPISPYAVARVSQELLSKVYAHGYGLQIILTRSFNHIGRWQNTRFVIPSFVKQLVDLKNHPEQAQVLYTGDTSIVRDFVDVRDVVHAYHLLLQKGQSGQVYNICSGKGHSLREVIALLGELMEMEIEIRTNPEFLRPADNPRIIGSYRKIAEEVGWKPRYSLRESLQDIIRFWEEEAVASTT